MKKALVLGSTGGIGNAVCALLVNQGHIVVLLDRGEISNIPQTLASENPDWVFNCIGVLGDNKSSFNEVFDPNVAVNWAIIKYYLGHLAANVRIVMVGSTSYESGRKNYILYSASKAALHNMWQGACENFEGTNIFLGLIHPGSVDTPMIAHLPKKANILSPQDVAISMVDLAKSMKSHQSLVHIDQKK
ncbi:SDR family oxidoreductase [Polynucleobacter sp. 73C-SIWE]|uniref:SDR family NAD(P)-dependent oxidoreductase n=1 Tax=Polynucleobacter sp. 73C-SIWE TaxID=2689098 RepID=UPI001C0D72A8|nr:SDR family oxidoreductase [Polynucleobacter sp. 73C-SIWE]MBU3578661.1 SDR family oxidoreductase [Polynucleobacter sp. 73C-SIWE]